MILGGRWCSTGLRRGRAMPETVKSRSAAGCALRRGFRLRHQAVLGLRPDRASDRGDHRAVRLQHPPERGTHERHRDCEPCRAQRRARQLAGLCRRDGIPRRLYVDRACRREEVRRRAAQVQRAASLTWSRTGKSIVQADDAEQFAVFKKRIEQFVDFRKELVRRGVEVSPAAGSRMGRQRGQSRRAHRAQQGS